MLEPCDSAAVMLMETTLSDKATKSEALREAEAEWATVEDMTAGTWDTCTNIPMVGDMGHLY